MDKVVKIVSMQESGTDFDFWQSKSPVERLQALFILRSRIFDLNPEYKKNGTRLQRVYKIVGRK